jgi:predicted secreted protein
MTITAAIVLYAMLWFLCLFVALPIRVRTQGEEGSVVPGTPSSAPANAMIGRKMAWTTVAATLLWAVVFSVIVWGGLTIRDIDV